MNAETMKKIDEIVAMFPIGEASAAKRGRNANWPYIAIIKNYLGREGSTHNPMGRSAYSTKEIAKDVAQNYINEFRADFRRKLLDPCHRALRRQYGLSEEID